MTRQRVLRAVLPATVRRRIRAWQLMEGAASRRAYVALDEGSSPRDEPVALRVRALGGGTMRVRPGSTDLQVLRDTFLSGYHLPPPDLEGEVRLIWDLGANVGMTLAHFCHLYPAARVVGVELDPANVSLCRLNIEPWRARCDVIEAAVWPYDGTVAYVFEPRRESGSRVAETGSHTARALSLTSLANGATTVDFLKMDIEGAERRVLREQTEWAERVRALKVELHDGYTIPECISDLERLGFQCRPDASHPACVVGVRRRDRRDR